MNGAMGVLAGVLLSLPLAAQEQEEVLKEVLVVAHVPSARLAVTPGGIAEVSGEELRERSITSLADLLRNVPGVWSVSDTGNDNIFFSSRGSNLDAVDYDMNGLRLLQDGLSVTAADGSNHNRMIDPLSVHTATIARGANALGYGASTLGGAIDFTSPTGRDRASREVLLNGGSHGHAQLRASAGGAWGERGDALVTVEGKRWSGYREHNQQRRTGLYANSGWQLSDRTGLRLFATWIRNEQELAGSLSRAQMHSDARQANAKAVSGHYQLDVEVQRLAARADLEFSAQHHLEFGVSYEEQSLFHPVVDRVMVPIGGVPTEVFSLLIDTRHRDAATMVRYHRRVGAHDLLFGLNYGHNAVDGGHYRNLGGERNGLSTRVDNTADSLEVYAMDRWRVSDLWLVEMALQGVSAGREVRNTTVATGALRNPQGSYSRINPRVGAIRYVGPDSSLFANLSQLYEPPTNFQLEDEATGSGAVLDAMHGTVVEVGSRGRHRLAGRAHLSWDIALYHAWIRDEILSVDDPAAPGTSLTANVGRTRHAGVEALLSAELPVGTAGRIVPMVSWTLNRFSFDRDPVYGNNELPAAPAHVIRGEILYRHQGLFAGPTFDIIGARHADFMNTYRVGAFTLFGLRAGWDAGQWQVSGELRNATNVRYVASHGVLDVAGPEAAILNPGEPRSAYFGLRVRL